MACCWLANAAVIKSGGTPPDPQVIVPIHGTKPIPLGTLKSIIEGSGLGVEDFR